MASNTWIYVFDVFDAITTSHQPPVVRLRFVYNLWYHFPFLNPLHESQQRVASRDLVSLGDGTLAFMDRAEKQKVTKNSDYLSQIHEIIVHTSFCTELVFHAFLLSC